MGTFNYDPIAIIIILVSLSLAPFVALMISSYVKLVIVMNLIRQAMGLQQVPPNMVINGLSLILTAYIMAPTLHNTIQNAIEVNSEFNKKSQAGVKYILPKEYSAHKDEDGFMLSGKTKRSAEQAKDLVETQALISSVLVPVKDFLIKHAGKKQRQFFLGIAKKLWPSSYTTNLKDDNLIILVPAFTVSELTAAFEIGFLIYLPFIAIDLIVSNILLAMGMMMVSPMTISLPFKLMLFVLVNGWSKLIEGLVLTYR